MDHLLAREKITNALRAAYARLVAKRDEINALNVFPVPDGDTGTNMVMTMTSVIQALEKVPSSPAEMWQRLSTAAMLGARGNSGVILSQFLRGFGEVMAQQFPPGVADIIQGMNRGVSKAEEALARPVEGTMLTVARAMAREAAAECSAEVLPTLRAALEGGLRALEKTPQQLEVLARAGVVDAGGLGLVALLEGFIAGYSGEAMVMDLPLAGTVSGFYKENEPLTSYTLEYLYCTELLLASSAPDSGELRDKLALLGDSMVVVAADGMVKVHIHTNHPGQVLEAALGHGQLHEVKVENMGLQHNHWLETGAEKKKDLGLVAVVEGDGLRKILTELGANAFVKGGGGINPSVGEIAAAIKGVNAAAVLVFPNHPNVSPAASRALETAGLPGRIMHTIDPAQAIACLLAYQPGVGLEENAIRMAGVIENLVSGQVARAERPFTLGDHDGSPGEWVGVRGDDLLAWGSTVKAALIASVGTMLSPQAEVLSLYYGQGITREDAGEVAGELRLRYPQLDVEVYEGGQPLYAYLFSLE